MLNTYFFPKIKTLLACFFISSIISSCGTQPTKTQSALPSEQVHTFVDSTLYFNSRNSSISMRATFEKGNDLTMSKGYLFQFRTIDNKPIFLSSVSVIAGGKRIFLEKKQLLLTPKEQITLSLPLEDSLFLAQFPTALLQFKQNNTSELFTIALHQLDIFIP